MICLLSTSTISNFDLVLHCILGRAILWLYHVDSSLAFKLQPSTHSHILS
jgi:hypothetical protein